MTLLPNFTLDRERQRTVYEDPAHLERWIVGLRKAGLPE